MNQSVGELAVKIKIYRVALAQNAHDPASGHVTILLHTFVGEDQETARKQARGPLREYLRSFLDNSQKRHESERGALEVDQEDIEFMLDRAFDDYVRGKALIGSPDSCAAVVDHLHEIGADEVGCFIDFGVAPETVLAGMDQLYELKRKYDVDQPAFPLTESQQGLWMLGEMDKAASRAYNETITLQMLGALDIPALRRSLTALAQRHDALRTTIDPEGETQKVLSEVKVDVPFVDCSSAPESAPRRLGEIESQPFDFTKAPGFRATIAKVGEENHLLSVVFHHVLGNGPSHWIFMEELVTIYTAESRGEKPTLERALQPRDFVRWRQTLDLQDSEAYWKGVYKELPPVLELPADHSRPPTLTYYGARQIQTFDAGCAQAEACRRGAEVLAVHDTLLGVQHPVASLDRAGRRRCWSAI